MQKTTKVSTIGLGLSLGLAWATGVLIVGFMALTMEQLTVEPFRSLFNIVYPGWGRSIGLTLLMCCLLCINLNHSYSILSACNGSCILLDKAYTTSVVGCSSWQFIKIFSLTVFQSLIIVSQSLKNCCDFLLLLK